MHEGIPIINFHVPKAFVHEDGKLLGMRFEIVRGAVRRQGPAHAGAHRRARRLLRMRRGAGRGRPGERLPVDRARLRHRLRRVGPAGARQGHLPVHACRSVFFGGDAAFGPKNIITAVAHGHEAAVSIDQLLHGEPVHARPPPHDQPDVAEDGHPRVELRQRHLATTCATRCRGPRPRRRWPASRSRSSSASTPPPPSRRRSAA